MLTRIIQRNKGFHCLAIGVFLFSFNTLVPGQISLAPPATTDAAEIFAPGLISTFFNERDFALNGNKDLLCFTIASFDNKKRCIVCAKKETDGWSNPDIVSFSGLYDDLEPFFAPNGQKLFFASNRPLPGETLTDDYNIWFTEVTDGNWKEPIPLDTTINQKGDEFYPSVAFNGNLYFTATRKDGIGKEDIFMAEYDGTAFAKPVVLPTQINSETYEFNAFINPSEDLLIFSSYGRKDDLGGGDLYFSKKDNNGKWSEAKHLPAPVNSKKLDYCPFFDEVNQTLYFSSNRKKSEISEFRSIDKFKAEQVSILNGFDNIFKINAKMLFD
jgi:hypothetical protein